MGFQKAKREQIWLKVLLAGPSGSGKTFSALRLAKGIAAAAVVELPQSTQRMVV